jgi:hypothetical protein
MRRFGIEPRTAAEQLQHDRPVGASEPFAPLPAPTGKAPYRLELASVLGSEPETLSLHVFGDSGGVKDPNPQNAVAAALIADHKARPVSLAYHVGDEVYFNGAESEYGPQLYEPYAHYNVPLLGVPGNHDGEPEPGGEPSLAAFMANFCSPTPKLPPRWAEYQRDTMDQPNCYFTLLSKHATIIGLYSNVPSGGVIEPDQYEWLVGELKDAPAGVPLIVALHHPPYSVDAHHGGSAKMGKLLDTAFTASGRAPEVVLSGHVHDYQWFVREWQGKPIGYGIIGCSGYHNTHALAPDAVAGTEIAPGVHYDYGYDAGFGFSRIDIEGSTIKGTFTGVSKDGTVTPNLHTWSASA